MTDARRWWGVRHLRWLFSTHRKHLRDWQLVLYFVQAVGNKEQFAFVHQQIDFEVDELNAIWRGDA